MKVSAGAYLADLAAGKSGHDVSTILEASNSGSPLSLKNLKVSLNSSCPSLFRKISKQAGGDVCMDIQDKTLTHPSANAIS